MSAVYSQNVEHDLLGTWGIAMFSDHAALILDEGEREGMTKLGGCRCLWVKVSTNGLSGIERDAGDKARAALDATRSAISGIPFFHPWLADPYAAKGMQEILYMPVSGPAS